MKLTKLTRIIILASLIIVLIILPFILNDVHWQTILSMICLSAVSTLGLYSIINIGLVSFAQGAFFFIFSYTVAIILLQTGVPFFVAWLAGAAIAAAVAFLTGMLVLRLKGAYFFLITLALNSFMGWIFSLWYGVTGGDSGLTNIPLPALLNTTTNLYYICLVLMIGALLYIIVTENSRLGLAMKATRQDDVMVQSFGVSPFRMKMISWVTCCVLAALAGGLQALVFRASFPTMFNLNASNSYLVYLIFGGRGSPIGAVVGSVIIIVGEEFLRPVAEFEPLIYGMILILTLIFLPGGLISIFKRGGFIGVFKKRPNFLLFGKSK